MKPRPIGVTILALLFVLNVVVYVVFVALAIINHGALVAVLRWLSPSGAGPETLHTAMGRVQPFYYAAMAVLTGAMAVGLWRLRNWARMVILGMIALSLLLLMGEFRPLLTAPTAGAIILTLVRIALSIFWIWYLLCRSVREAFRQNSAAATGV